MLPGFNHNVKYKDRVFHIQTEDSGASNPHIITHLFVGGNIVATMRTSYADLVAARGTQGLEDDVEKLMQKQHKGMLKNLVHGKYDNAANIEGAHHLDGPLPLNVDAKVLAETGGSGGRKDLVSGESGGAPAGPDASPGRPAPTAAVAAPVPGAPAALRPPPTPPPPMPKATFPSLGGPPGAAGRPGGPIPVVTGSRPTPAHGVQRPPPPPLRPAQAPTPVMGTPRAPSPTLPPRSSPTAPGGIPMANLAAAAAAAVAAFPKSTTPGPVRPPHAPATLPPEVLAARSLTEKPVEKPVTGSTIFGEDLISENRLDEVILSYLATEDDKDA
jgi:hypothetical protein